MKNNKKNDRVIRDKSKDITIVIITYNRYPFLMRLLQFYEEFKYDFHYLILDSSNDDINDQMKFYLKMKNVIYKKYDPSVFFTEKISDGCKSINTPFAVLCADDDFLIPSGIIASYDFLLKNEDYASAHGLYFNHTSFEKAQNIGFSIGPIYNGGISVEHDNAVNRLKIYFSGKAKNNPLYALHRTNLFQLIWKETNVYVSDWGLSEKFPCAISLIYGKMKRLPVFYSSREPNTFSWYDEERYRKMYTDKKLDLAFKGFKKHLIATDKMFDKDLFSIVNNSFKSYLSKVDKKISYKPNKFVSIIRLLRKNISFRTRLSKLIIKGCHFSIYPQYMDDYKILRNSVINGNMTTQAELNRSRKQYSNQKII